MARELNIRITGDNSQAEAALSQTEASIQRVTSGPKTDPQTVAIFDKIKKGSKDAGDAAEESEPKLNKAAVAWGKMAGAAAGFAAVKGVQAALDLASGLSDLSKSTGMSVEFLQKLNIAAATNGTTMETAARGVFALQQAVVNGNPKIIAALNDLGFSQQQLIAMKPEEMFTRVGAAIAKIENPTLLAAKASQIFKGTADDLIPILLDGFEKTSDGAIVWSRLQVENMAKVQSNWTKMKISLVGGFGEITSGFFSMWGSWQAIEDQWTYNAVAAVFKIRTAFIDMKNSVIGSVTATYEGVSTWMGSKLKAVTDTVKGMTDSVTGWFGDMYKKVVGGSFVPDMVTGIGREFERLVDVMVNPAYSATSKVAGFFGSLASMVGGAAGSILNAIGGIFQGVSALSSVMNGAGAASGASGGIGAIGGLLGGGGGASGLAGMAGTLGTLGTIAAVGTATLGIGAAAYAAYVGIDAIWGNSGRDMVVKFADQLGGFDRLHAALLTGGDAGEAMWVRLTQGVSRNDKGEAQSAIAATVAFLQRLPGQTPAAAPAPAPGPPAGFSDEEGMHRTHDGFPVMDSPLRAVTRAGWMFGKPGDIAGMPAMGDRTGRGGGATINITFAQPVFLGNRESARAIAEHIVRALPFAVRRYGVG